MQTEDLNTFFDSDELASVGSFGVDSAVSGQFVREYAEVNGAEGYYPTFTCQASAVSSLSVGGAITIDGQSYTVLAKRPDGTGVITMILQESV